MAAGLLIFIGIVGCGDSAADEEGQQEAAFDYSSLVAMEPDSFLRPDAQWISSYRLPATQYGFQMAFDGKDSTYWSTAPGLNHLEGFEWIFDGPVNLGHVHIKTVHGAVFSQPDRILVMSDQGQVWGLPNANIGLPDSITWLKVMFILDKNWSRVALPLRNSPFSSIVKNRKGLSVLFESKPIGISEIHVSNLGLTCAPFISTDGFVRITEQQRSNERFDLNDGRRNSWLELSHSIPERRIFVQFPDLRPILGFRIHSASTPISCLQLAWHKPNGSTDFFMVSNGIWEHRFRNDTLATKNISFTLRLLEGETMYISEFDFWDGARWFRVQEDSLQQKLDPKSYSSPLPSAWPLNKSISFDEGFGKATEGGSDWETERDASGETTASHHVLVLFRANGLFEMLWNSNKSVGADSNCKSFSGTWKWNQGKLELNGIVSLEKGVFEKKTIYSVLGNRLIPESKEFPEFEFTY